MFKQIMDIICPSVFLGIGAVLLVTAIGTGAGLESIVVSSLICFAAILWLILSIVGVVKKIKK